MNNDPSSIWHVLPSDKVLDQLQSDRQLGLTSAQAAERQQQYGLNELQETGGRSSWTILVDQFKNIMLILLIAVAVISGSLDLMDLMEGKAAPGSIPFKDTIAILSIVILNGVLGYLQESGAEKALAALKSMSSPNVRVLRDGKLQEVGSPELVPGDVMLMEAGVQVAADGRLLDAVNLQVRESALTGEAHAVSKQVDVELADNTSLGDRLNSIFQGTEVVMGRGTAVVTQTGMKTELGKIATLLQSVETEQTPLQRRMDQLSRTLVFWALVLVAIVVVGGLVVAGMGSLRDLLEVGLSMAVAVVPEGLPAVITVTLALGTQRMVKRQALIRRLPAVETLGSVTTICSDKTGTLTQNKMVVQSVQTLDQRFKVTGHGYIPEGRFYDATGAAITQLSHELKLLLIACALCNDAALQKENGEWAMLGDPTEGALLTVAGKAAIWQPNYSHQLPRVAEFPFSSERKRMSVIVQDEGAGVYILMAKGSPEILLERCQSFQSGDQAKELQSEQRTYILEQNNKLASEGLRVLGFAYKLLNQSPGQNTTESMAEDTEQGMTWLGLVDMLDAPRPEVREAVARCRTAGIRPVMITGDHQLTARAIAQDLGIAESGAEVLIGQDLEKMSQAELQERVGQVGIYARVAPEHKLRIVQALQSQGKVVAMTGDGVNDAPALKQAAIGIAMGITGTDVSKEASDMVLQDDNFATIVAAVEEGRVVYTNIRRFIKYILGSNIGEVLTIASAPLLLATGGLPLSPLQILWMNLVTDGLPALALAVEPAEPNVMNRAPYDPSESIFARGLGFYMVRIGIVLAIVTITLMVWAYGYTQNTGTDPERWKTMVFTTLCLAQMGHAIAVRSNNRLTIELNPFSNPFLLIAVVATSILQLMLIYVAPLRDFFGTHVLSMTELAICCGASMLVFVYVEMEKLVQRIYGKQG
jgi:P-type Ca2+ transporter type 2C